MRIVPFSSVERSMRSTAGAPGGDNNPQTSITIMKALLRDICFYPIIREGRAAALTANPYFLGASVLGASVPADLMPTSSISKMSVVLGMMAWPMPCSP
jgi:hypothetical protein